MANRKDLFNIAFFSAVIAAAFYFFSSNQIDPDLWGHVTFGQYIVEHLKFPRTDIYSYTAYGSIWVNHEWLAESFFYIIYKFFANAGLVICKTIVGILTIIPAYFVMRRRTSNVILQAILFFAMWVMAYGFSMRPHIFTFMFFAWVIYLFSRYTDTGERKYLLAVPLMFLS